MINVIRGLTTNRGAFNNIHGAQYNNSRNTNDHIAGDMNSYHTENHGNNNVTNNGANYAARPGRAQRRPPAPRHDHGYEDSSMGYDRYGPEPPYQRRDDRQQLPPRNSYDDRGYGPQSAPPRYDQCYNPQSPDPQGCPRDLPPSVAPRPAPLPHMGSVLAEVEQGLPNQYPQQAPRSHILTSQSRRSSKKPYHKQAADRKIYKDESKYGDDSAAGDGADTGNRPSIYSSAPKEDTEAFIAENLDSHLDVDSAARAGNDANEAGDYYQRTENGALHSPISNDGNEDTTSVLNDLANQSDASNWISNFFITKNNGGHNTTHNQSVVYEQWHEIFPFLNSLFSAHPVPKEPEGSERPEPQNKVQETQDQDLSGRLSKAFWPARFRRFLGPKSPALLYYLLVLAVSGDPLSHLCALWPKLAQNSVEKPARQILMPPGPHSI
ncbi:hypothetical protein VNI00_012968 [Paramarasmius palmivorus]|uniref:Uncharacterized protein n=1 Tax=Paramarasmius palmivorus TaxID=297713 RepID=A0AAW0C0A1_9AGAR